MDKFDEKIIGYEATKNILRQILDTLKRPELYKSKGASIPRGLLMESDPGLGKSLLATVFIKESGRKSEVFGTGVKMWLLSQGSKVKVTAPEMLVQEMKQEIERMNGQY